MMLPAKTDIQQELVLDKKLIKLFSFQANDELLLLKRNRSYSEEMQTLKTQAVLEPKSA